MYQSHGPDLVPTPPPQPEIPLVHPCLSLGTPSRSQCLEHASASTLRTNSHWAPRIRTCTRIRDAQPTHAASGPGLAPLCRTPGPLARYSLPASKTARHHHVPPCSIGQAGGQPNPGPLCAPYGAAVPKAEAAPPSGATVSVHGQHPHLGGRSSGAETGNGGGV